MQNRNIALDVLRGLTIATMVIVNNPGSYQYRYAPLCHSAWSGCTICDLVFPFFLFCVGVSMAFSLAKYTSFSAEAVKNILRRGALIFLVGLFLNTFPFVPLVPHDSQASFGQNWIWWLQHVRIFGVLQRISLCFIVGALLSMVLRKPRRIAISILVLTVAHWLILRFCGTFPGWDTLEGNISSQVDIALIGENHMYRGYGIPFDPEGLLGVLSGTGTVLLGYLAGHILRSAENASDATASLFALSGLCLAIGCIWSIWLPINKPLWTGSYVFYAGGWSLFMLAFLNYCIAVRGWERYFTPLKIFGMNSMAIFVASGLFVRIFAMIVHWCAADGSVVTPLNWYYNNCMAALFGNCEFASLIYAVTIMLLMFLLALFLYRRKIFIRL